MAYGFYSLVDKLRVYGSPTRYEKRWLLISVFVMAFILGFDDGREVFEFSAWMGNFLLGLIAIIIAVFVHETVHRIFGLEQGYRTDFKPFFYGLIAGMVLTSMSYGKILFLAYSGVRLHMMDKHRLGYFRHRTGYFQLGKIAALGPIANLFVATVFYFVPGAFAQKVVLVNALFAVTNMLPIPPLDGTYIVYATRRFYFMLLGFIFPLGLFFILTAYGIHAFSFIYAVVLSVVFGLMGFVVWSMKFESGGWD